MENSEVKTKTKINLPTKITISRIVLAVLLLLAIFIIYYLDYFKVFEVSSLNIDMIGGKVSINLINIIILVVFLIASLTDFVDGYLARKNNMVTDLGKFLDPLADKMLINGIMVFLALNFTSLSDHLTFPFFLVILMIIRDLIVDSLRFVAASKGRVIAANIFGKAKTVSEMVAITVVLLNGLPFSFFDNSWPQLLHISDFICYISCFLSLLSGVIYLKDNYKVLID